MFIDLLHAIARHDHKVVRGLLVGDQALARQRIAVGANRQAEGEFFMEAIEHHLYEGDTALHVAAAAYNATAATHLLRIGADIHSQNRLGQEPLHYAALGTPGAARWNPNAQAEMLRLLVAAGADANAIDRSGVAPLHRAVRSRCAEAVRVLIELGADPRKPNRSGSTPLKLAERTTGRGGSGSPEAKAEQQEILRLLRGYSAD